MFLVIKQVHAGGMELQDRADFFEHGSTVFLVLADGAGGMGGGAEAAEYVVQSVKEAAATIVLNSEGLTNLLIRIDRQMAEIGAFGEATCVVVALSDTGFVGASVGDSGAYVFSPNGKENLTLGQIRKPFLGSGRAIPVGFARESTEGTLLVASDGLLKYASLEKISAAAAEPNLDEAARKLLELVRYQTGALPDDVSILLARRQ